MKLSTSAIALALTAAILPLAVGAVDVNGPRYINVENETNNCAWITIYNSRAWSAWEIVGDTANRPRFVKAHESYTFAVNRSWPDVKVRAEVKGPNCEGGTIRDTYDERKGLPDPAVGKGKDVSTMELKAHLVYIPGNNFFMWWK